MKKLFLIPILFLLNFLTITAQYTKIETSVTSGTFYKVAIFRPASFNPANTYPLILSFHGYGETGNGTGNISRLYNAGLAKVMNDGYVPSTDYIIVCPQDNWGSVDGANVPGILTWVKGLYNIDLNRIYITGYSGGGGTTNSATMNISAAFLSNFAGIVSFSPAAEFTGNASWFKTAGVKGFWSLSGLNSGKEGSDGYFARAASTANSINAQVPGLAKLSQKSGIGHGGSFNTLYSGAFSDGGVTFWSYIGGLARDGASNIPPTSNAGTDKAVTLPTTTTTLTGSGADSDGTIASYLWTKQSGPAGGTITSSTSATTGITALQAGTYVFRLRVTDNGGATATDDVTVSVSATNVAPISNAGSDKVITLPTTSTTLIGSGSDADGTISAYLWTKVSGPTGGTISTSTTSTTNITALQQGVYVFRLRVTDNVGAVGNDDVTVTVNPIPVTGKLFKPATGEYSIGFISTTGVVKTPLEISYNTTYTNTNVTGLTGIIDGDGGQYHSIYLKDDGTVYTISGNNITPTSYPVDNLGNAFTADKVYGMWRNCLALKDGKVYYWSSGSDVDKEDILRQFGAYADDILEPRLLVQPAGGSKYLKELIFKSSTGGVSAVLWGLCTDGTMWEWREGVTTPIQVVGKEGFAQTFSGTVTNAAMMGPYVKMVVTSTNQVWVWGTQGQALGGHYDLQNLPMDNVASNLTAAGVVFPLKKVIANYFTMYVIDANDNLFTAGQSQSGTAGTGYMAPSYRTNWNGASNFVYGNSTNIDQGLQPWTQVPGKWKDIVTNTSYVFYAYGQDMGDNWYSWGRNKAKSLGNGVTWGAIDQGNYPEYHDVPAPRRVDPIVNTGWVVSPAQGALNVATARTPLANAGINQYLPSGTSSTLLYGTGSHQNQPTNALTVTMTNQWTRVSGPNTPTITNPTSQITTVAGMVAGTYVFRNTVTNSLGATDFQEVTVVVNNPTLPGNTIRGIFKFKNI